MPCLDPFLLLTFSHCLSHFLEALCKGRIGISHTLCKAVKFGVRLAFAELCAQRREAQEALWPPTGRAPSRPGKQYAAVHTGRRVCAGWGWRGQRASWAGQATGERAVLSS